MEVQNEITERRAMWRQMTPWQRAEIVRGEAATYAEWARRRKRRNRNAMRAMRGVVPKKELEAMSVTA